MAEKKYCIKTETLAGFAKALGHPARIAIMKFLAKQNTCYFGDIHEELPIATARPSPSYCSDGCSMPCCKQHTSNHLYSIIINN